MMINTSGLRPQGLIRLLANGVSKTSSRRRLYKSWTTGELLVNYMLLLSQLAVGLRDEIIKVEILEESMNKGH